MELSGKHVVVTGASQGIGEQMAAEFASKGAVVLVVARSTDKLAVVAEHIRGHSLSADLSSADGVDGLVERCIEALGHIDIWVNNAGVETDDAFINMDRDDIRRLARVNFEAPLMLTRDVVPHLMSRGGGHVVQMSSLAGAMSFPGLAAYAGSKAGLTNFTETLRIELAGTGVGLTVVAPGPVDTPMWDRLNTGSGYVQPALTRFRHLLLLPTVDPAKIAAATVAAVAKDKRHVRIPTRFAAVHIFNNLPRRAIELALTGVKLPLK